MVGHLLKMRVKRLYWALVNRVNRLTYLHHLVDNCHPDSLYDYEQEIEELLMTESRIWIKRAERVHVAVSDIPFADPAKTSHWNVCHYFEGMQYLDWDTLRKFKALIEDKEYERRRRTHEGREIWIKWVTVVAAIIGAVASLMTYFSHGKPSK
jgi:hypothetical protein